MGANYVARQVDYQMTRGWGQGDKAANAYFRPVETFGPRFEEILVDIRAMGFDAMDMWTSHLNWAWTTEEHMAIARDLLRKYNLRVVSVGGWFGSTPAEFEACCKLAAGLGTDLLGGSTSVLEKDRAFVVRILKKYGQRLAIENHPEKSADELMAKIGNGGDGTLGAAVDTGWFGTQGCDAAEAIEKIGDYVWHVHLKDVRAPGAHDTCRFGQGCVPIEGCVRVLQKQGYTGAFSIEHEPELFDPTEDCRAGLAMLKGWLNGR